MKFYRYLNLILLIISFCPNAMQLDLKTAPYIVPYAIPVGVLQEIAKSGINLNAVTEKEMFALTDKFMRTGGRPAKAIMNLVKEAGLKKNIPNYTYGDFKADIMNDLIIKKANKKDLSQFKINNDMLDMAIKMEAFNWAKHILKYNKSLKEILNDKFNRVYLKEFASLIKNTTIDIEKIDSLLNTIEIFLKFDAKSDSYSMPILLDNTNNENINLTIRLIKLLSKYDNNLKKIIQNLFKNFMLNKEISKAQLLSKIAISANINYQL